jgi:hypothetical protein
MMHCNEVFMRGRALRSFLILASLLAAGAAQAASSCFTQAEIEAADLRVLQQQFNVAALNCRTADPADPTFAERYNRFIKLFSPQLQDNSEILYHHFGRDGRTLDRWMTRVANEAGQGVYKKSDFCQVAWDRLDHMITLNGEQMQAFAVQTAAAGDLAPPCPLKTPKKQAR